MRIALNRQELFVWHSWFAWHPVIFTDRKWGRCFVWLETIERCQDSLYVESNSTSSGDVFYSYRLPSLGDVSDG